MRRFYLKFGIHSIPVRGSVVTIGRAATSDIRLEGPAISRTHASLLVDGDVLSVRDEQSKNGVFVNGRRIERTTPLVLGDTLTIADEEILVHVEETSVDDAVDSPTGDIPRGRPTPSDLRSLAVLSHREQQVFKMLAQGYNNRDIGERLRLSPKTIATYRSRLVEKLGARSRADLVKAAVRMGVLGGDTQNAIEVGQVSDSEAE